MIGSPADGISVRTAIGLIVLYCLLHYLIRLWESPVFSLDEAEQILMSQKLDWGYRFRHPPLISWIYAGAELSVSLSRPVFFGLKYAIMAGGFVAFFFAARIVLRRVDWALAATASWAMTYVLGWWPHADLMHTVLLMSLLSVSLWTGLLAFSRGKWTDWLWFGVSIGLGALSKYVHAAFPAALILAALTLAPYRASLRPLRLFASLAVAALILAPYGIWVASYGYSLPELASGVTRQMPGADGMPSWLAGILAYLEAVLSFLLPFLLVAVLVFPGSVRGLARPDLESGAVDRNAVSLLWRATLIALAGGLIALLVTGGEHFKNRWMHQSLLAVPILLLAAALSRGASGKRLKIYLGIAAGFVVLVIGVRIAAWPLSPAFDCGKCRPYQPVGVWAEDLQKAGFRSGTLVGRDHQIVGNLHWLLKRAPGAAEVRTVDASFPLHVYPAPSVQAGQCLAVWRGQGDMPEPLARYLADEMAVAPVNRSPELTFTRPILAPFGFNSEKSNAQPGTEQRTETLNIRFLPASAACQ